ncbi:MAG: twin-arginine translocase subunit TatB [Pelagibacterales bacterium]|nr:twin-arginine translocase subunit TatB [Pelagibacterales bacterium]PPR16467.1 MAG: Sec-independent protein translocase protein TatB [Alphaproteobacteria bacterium MarineAlpha9_Bin3]|tara:strand:+ start:10230 stop:10679 length:450 start_codon:yes stop_codon:yes gene_type:complete
MLDIGWTEILVITVVALFIVGPKDIPKALRTIGIWIGKLKSLSREFQNTVEDAVRDSELDEVKKQIESAKNNFKKDMTETIDSEGELTEMLRGVDVVDKDKSQKNSAWPIPLNKKEELEDNNIQKKDIDNKNDNVKEVDNNLDKDSSTT